MVLVAGYIVGILAGAIMGYYGGWTDILLQRFIEIWGSVPFLFLIMIVASIVDPGFWVLVIFLVILRSWMAITRFGVSSIGRKRGITCRQPSAVASAT